MPAPVLRTLVICDLADSTALVEKLGDQRGAEVMRQHDRLARDLVERHHGHEIDKTDGFLILFERPVHAVAFALAYQRELRALSKSESLPLAARIGIHVGDVVIWDNTAHDVARGAKPVEVEGLVKPTAARIMSIARPGQILLSSMVSTLSQRARSELGAGAANVRWQPHGNYRFKGVPDPVQVHEVGEDGIAPFRAPAWTGKAHREIPWWRRPGMLFVEAAVVIAVVAIPAYFSLRSPPAIAFAERDWVVVGDLRNLTGQGSLDGSLDTAFRVSLEQSHFVNLVPSLQVSDALKRMARPDGTRVDRAVGAEIALREGARALILPSIAEIGGRVRVTAEVVDPNTQATVYAETADGRGLESILPSVGKVADQLRGRLGESLAAIQGASAPLSKVTTPNLDALRAYTLGRQAYSTGHWGDALGLYAQALKLDPEFALAYQAQAAAHMGGGDIAAAKSELQHALALRERLSPRDLLETEVSLAMLGKPTEAMEMSQRLAKLYPDTYSAWYTYALMAYFQGDYEAGISGLQHGLNEHNPARGRFYYFLGALQLATDDYSAADRSLAQAQALHSESLGLVIADAAAARRRLDTANQALTTSKATGVASNDIAQKLTATVLLADQGRWTEALEAGDAAASTADAIGAFLGRRYRTAQLGLLVHSAPRTAFLRSLRSFLDGEIAAFKRSDDPDRPATMAQLAFGAYLAARAGDPDLANVVLALMRDEVRSSGYAMLENLFAVASAQRAIAMGKAEDAIATLKAALNGNELFVTHVALREAFAASGREGAALEEAVWLARHRGRAYEEANDYQALQPFNVVESDLALLSEAEHARRLDNNGQAERAMQEFRTAWPAADQIGFLYVRLRQWTAAHAANDAVAFANRR